MSNRRLVQLRVTWDAYRLVARWAKEETDGNWSEMARILMSEAVTARAKRGRT